MTRTDECENSRDVEAIEGEPDFLEVLVVHQPGDVVGADDAGRVGRRPVRRDDHTAVLFLAEHSLVALCQQCFEHSSSSVCERRR